MSSVLLEMSAFCWKCQAKVGLGMAVSKAFGRQVGSGTAVSSALGRQVGPGTAVWGGLGRQVGSGMAVLGTLGRSWGQNKVSGPFAGPKHLAEIFV